MTPAIQGIMSRKTRMDSQGELQGVLTSMAALAMVISPLIMTWIFAIFASADAPVFLPGAPFLLSMALMGVCYLVLLRVPRAEPA